MSTIPNVADEYGEAERPKRRSITLMDLTIEDIKKIHDTFENSKNKIMNKFQFKEVIESMVKMSLPEEEYNILFMMMDEKRNGAVDWDEFVSHLIIDLQEKDRVVSKEMWQAPLNSPPIYQSSGHRHPITQILFFPAIKQDRTPSTTDGRFVTLSKDGTINFWSTSFELEKTCYSKTYERRVHPTWVTGLVCLPDINMMATSSTERDLRFYDTMAMRFDLRIVITSLEKAVTCMAYHMGSPTDGISHLVTGDMGGHVRIFSFGKGLIIEGKQDVKAGARGPFSFKAGDDVKIYFYEDVRKGALPLLLVTEYLESHPGVWVEQVSFYPILRSFISCAGSSEKSLILRDMRTSIKVDYNFNISKGVYCFAVDEGRYMMATGGSDCVVRIWNAFVPKKPIVVFTGHHSGIRGLEFMLEGMRLLSISNDKCIKIWDIGVASCIQTYTQLTSEIGEHAKLSVYFHHSFKKLIVGSLKLAFIHYGPPEDETNSDGTTHFLSVTKALYNPLFKFLVTVGNDSAIMIWDVWTGKCSSIITEAHTRIEYGLKVPVEITAAAFDPISHQLLVTGARDGTLKIWNFNSGLCIRHMTIEKNCEVTSVLWLQNRIMAVGWNRHITEFADLDSTELFLDENRRGSLGSTWPTIPRCADKFGKGSDLAEKYDGKAWEIRHSEDIVSAVAQPPQALATASYNGELILWRLETAQPYRRYHVGNPTDRMTLDFKKARHMDNDITDSPYSKNTSTPSAKERLITATSKKSLSHKSSRLTMKTSSSKVTSSADSSASESSTTVSRKLIKFKVQSQSSHKLRKKTLMQIHLPPEQESIRPVVIHCLLFLNARPCLPNVGTLLVSLEDGNIQVWCHCLTQSNQSQEIQKKKSNESTTDKPNYGFLGSFLAIHSVGDYVVSMNTDHSNEYLFTGDSAGYIKVWLLKNYFAPTPTPEIVMPLYRIQFPFLLRDRLDGRAKRAIRGQALPLLLSSHQAHLRAITYIEYIAEGKIIVSCSSDCSVRVWTLGGRYIGTLGQSYPWPKLEHGKEVDNVPSRIPFEISKVASFTSIKVLTGANSENKNQTNIDETYTKDVITALDLETKVYGQRADSNHPLGTYFRLPERSRKVHPPVKIDNSYGYLVPVYGHVHCPPPSFLGELTTPISVARIQEQRMVTDEQQKPERHTYSNGITEKKEGNKLKRSRRLKKNLTTTKTC